MSGDSPNAFTNEALFDFREGRSSPAPTTSKDHAHDPSGVVNASILVEPNKDKNKDEKKNDDEIDFASPILNNPEEKSRRDSSGEQTLELNDLKYDGPGKDKDKEEKSLLNGGPDRLPPASFTRPKEDDEESDMNECAVNCIYYTMECCKCSIM